MTKKSLGKQRTVRGEYSPDFKEKTASPIPNMGRQYLEIDSPTDDAPEQGWYPKGMAAKLPRK